MITTPQLETAQRIKALVKLLVSNPEKVRLKLIEKASSHELIIECDPADNRHVIGRRGMLWKSLRSLVMMANCKLRPPLFLMPIQSEGPALRTPEEPDFRVNPDWPRMTISAALLDIGKSIFSKAEYVAEMPMGMADSILCLHVGNDEPNQVINTTVQALSVLFTTIGVRQGRMLTIEIVPDLIPASRQPADNAGRSGTVRIV